MSEPALTESGIVPPGTVTESEATRAAPRLRQQPFTLLFPVGVALSWAGVTHWLLYATGLLAEYRPVFHAMVQTQGFLTCLALGFLFTMIPRRTGTAPPSLLEVGIAVAGPVVVTIAAWNSWWLQAHIVWLVVVSTAVRFVVIRFRDAQARRRPPNGFVWIPLALAMGVIGAAMQVVAAWSESGLVWAQLGAAMVRQGMFVGLVLGVGSLALPLMTRGQGPPDGTTTGRDRLVRAAHLTGGLLLMASFWIEVTIAMRPAMLLRAGVVLVALLAAAQIWRPPTRPGWSARLIWGAAWLLPLGYLLAAAYPLRFRAGLHVSFVGGLAMMALAVSAQVILGHGGYRDVLFGRSAALGSMAALMVAATAARVLMEFDRLATFRWMGVAAALFLAATVAWAIAVAPGLIRPRRDQ